MKVKKAVIPAAGFGTRMLPAAKSVPKEMICIAGKPAIHYIVKEAVDAGIEDILIITSRGKTAIEDYFDYSPELEMRLERSGKLELIEELHAIADMANITFIRQKELKGLGHAVMHARSFTGDEPFAVLLGDDIMRSETPVTKQLVEQAEKYSCSCVGVKKVETSEISKYCSLGVKALGDGLFDVQELIEKPTPDKVLSNYAILGRYVLTSGIYELLENAKPGFGGEIQLTDALNLLCRKERMLALEFEGERFDSGNICGYMEASIQLALANPEISDWLKNYMKGLDI
ncbi:MAG: UTP--glucose-1-phosphate uridylyltransferase GalU [Oscillospiraceae bacterium]|nr:UTP--glucose-1-phosphate uridylyltransferase GalU [Oscillospiraceae bacterium]